MSILKKLSGALLLFPLMGFSATSMDWSNNSSMGTMASCGNLAATCNYTATAPQYVCLLNSLGTLVQTSGGVVYEWPDVDSNVVSSDDTAWFVIPGVGEFKLFIDYDTPKLAATIQSASVPYAIMWTMVDSYLAKCKTANP